MSSQAKIVLLIIALAISIAVGLYLANPASTPTQEPQTNTPPQAIEYPKEYKELPPFIMGKVASMQGSTITLNIGKEEKTVILDEGVVFISQVKDGDSYKNVPATINDMHVSSEVVVYFGRTPELKDKVEKIQIFAFK